MPANSLAKRITRLEDLAPKPTQELNEFFAMIAPALVMIAEENQSSSDECLTTALWHGLGFEDGMPMHPTVDDAVEFFSRAVSWISNAKWEGRQIPNFTVDEPSQNADYQ